MALRRGARRTDEEWTAAAHALFALLAEATGRADLGDVALLDVGCGNKFAAAIVNDGVPIRRYVGIDTDEEVIRHLIEHVVDPRLAFHFLDAHNEMYNQAGQPLDSFGRLPVGEEQFDLISLFSVFTHLAPHDYRAMLELIRPHVAPDGKLIFSLFVDQGDGPDFLDRVPDRPLLEAVYSEPYARRLIEGTGWEVDELRAPVRTVVQHHFICRPA